MPLNSLIKKSREACISKIHDILGDDYNDPEVRKHIEGMLDLYLDELKTNVLDGETAEPLPGEVCEKFVVQLTKDLLLDMYEQELALPNFIRIDVLSIEATRINKGNDDFKDIIENLNPDFQKLYDKALRKNKKCNMFTVSDIIYYVIATLTIIFIPIVAILILLKFLTERKLKKKYSERNYLLAVRFLKYSELITRSCYTKEYFDFDKEFEENKEAYTFKDQNEEKQKELKEEELLNQKMIPLSNEELDNLYVEKGILKEENRYDVREKNDEIERLKQEIERLKQENNKN